MNKTTVLLLCGGRSDEHEISLISAKHLLQALDRSRFEPVLVGISKDGIWYLEEEDTYCEGGPSASTIRLNTHRPCVSLAPFRQNGRGFLLCEGKEIPFDVAFPILHGPFGEDGTVQGLFDTIGVPYVGSNCGSSWNCMDKERTKILCANSGIPSTEYVVLNSKEAFESSAERIAELGLPVFVKPARQGSSIGINKVSKLKFLEDAVLEAFCFDNKVLVEKAVNGRELECGILGLRGKARASSVGEIVVGDANRFYSYDEKYLASKTELKIPAALDPSQANAIQTFALQAYSAMECDGMARVDVFLQSDGTLLLNEINTIPGFTPISMFPKLWEHSGVSYAELISELIELAYRRRGDTL